MWDDDDDDDDVREKEAAERKDPISLPPKALRIARLTFDLAARTRATSSITGSPWMQSAGRKSFGGRGQRKRERKRARVWFDFDEAGPERSQGGGGGWLELTTK